MSRSLRRTLGLVAGLAAAAATFAGGAAATIAPLKRFPIPRDSARFPSRPTPPPVARPVPPPAPPTTVAPSEPPQVVEASPPRVSPPSPPRRRWR